MISVLTVSLGVDVVEPKRSPVWAAAVVEGVRLKLSPVWAAAVVEGFRLEYPCAATGSKGSD